MKKFLYGFVSIMSFVCFVTIFNIKGYCANALAGSALWNSYMLASEYFAGTTGSRIAGSENVSTDISGISGISNGTASQTYSTAVNSGFSQSITLENIASNLRGVNNVENLNELGMYLLSAQHQQETEFKLKTLYAGPFQLYTAWKYNEQTQQDEWLGDSYDNIYVSFDDSAQNKLSMADAMQAEFPDWVHNLLYGKNFAFDNGISSYAANLQINYINMYFNDSVVLCGQSTKGGGYVIAITTYPTDIPCRGNISFTTTNNGITYNYNLTKCSLNPNADIYGSFVLNGVTYYYGYLTVNYQGGGTRFGLNKNITPYYQNVISALQGGTVVLKPYTVGVKDDNENVVSLGDLNGKAVSMSDLYDILSKYRDSTLILDGNGATSTLDDTKLGELADSIAASIAAAITIDGTIADEEEEEITVEGYTGISVPSDYPTDYLNTFVDIFNIPFDFFKIFEPVFHIVGINSGSWAIWMFVPSLFVILLFIWVLK